MHQVGFFTCPGRSLCREEIQKEAKDRRSAFWSMTAKQEIVRPTVMTKLLPLRTKVSVSSLPLASYPVRELVKVAGNHQAPVLSATAEREENTQVSELWFGG